MLKPKEIGEISLALWYLPLHKLQQVKQLVLELKKDCGYDEPLDDSDEWTEEDQREMSEAAMVEWDTREERTDGDSSAQAG